MSGPPTGWLVWPPAQWPGWPPAQWTGWPTSGGPAEATQPSVPACAEDGGSWCARVYGWTHSDFLARSADITVGRGLDIVLIVVLAVLARALLHRAIDKVMVGAAAGNGHVLSALRRHTPSRLKDLAAPLRSERRVQRASTVASVLRSITSVMVLVVASIMVMAEFGLNLAPVLASAGIAGVAIGFGAQNLVRDFLSGMFMLLEDQYGVGDVVDLGQASGTVEAVGLRITTVRDVHGTVWFVRNGAITRVGNKSQGYAVAVVDLPLAHTADVTEAITIAGREATQVAARPEVAALLLEPPTVLGVEAVTIEGIMLRLTVKVQPGQQWAVQRALNAAITDAFDDAGIPRPGITLGRAPADTPSPTTAPSDDSGSTS